MRLLREGDQHLSCRSLSVLGKDGREVIKLSPNYEKTSDGGESDFADPTIELLHNYTNGTSRTVAVFGSRFTPYIQFMDWDGEPYITIGGDVGSPVVRVASVHRPGERWGIVGKGFVEMRADSFEGNSLTVQSPQGNKQISIAIAADGEAGIALNRVLHEGDTWGTTELHSQVDMPDFTPDHLFLEWDELDPKIQFLYAERAKFEKEAGADFLSAEEPWPLELIEIARGLHRRARTRWLVDIDHLRASLRDQIERSMQERIPGFRVPEQALDIILQQAATGRAPGTHQLSLFDDD